MPKAVDRDQKRAELVAASWDVIAAEGLRGATLRRVAAEAGCTTGALTHYFADRQALLVAALRAAHFQAAERMGATARAASTPEDRLRAVLLESLPLDARRLREWRVWLAFWGETAHDPELAAEDARRYEEWQTLLVELLAPLVGTGPRAQEEAASLVALVDGLGLRIAREPLGGEVSSEASRECRATLDRALAALST